MLPAFRAMSDTILSLLGEDSFLRGSEPCKVNIKHGVRLTGEDTQYEQQLSAKYMSYVFDVATIAVQMNPKVNDTLQHPDGNYVLDTRLADNGHNRRFVLRKA